MRPSFQDLAMVQHNDLICILHRGQAVSNDHYRPALCCSVQRILNSSFTFCVQCTCTQLAESDKAEVKMAAQCYGGRDGCKTGLFLQGLCKAGAPPPPPL